MWRAGKNSHMSPWRSFQLQNRFWELVDGLRSLVHLESSVAAGYARWLLFSLDQIDYHPGCHQCLLSPSLCWRSQRFPANVDISVSQMVQQCAHIWSSDHKCSLSIKVWIFSASKYGSRSSSRPKGFPTSILNSYGRTHNPIVITLHYVNKTVYRLHLMLFTKVIIFLQAFQHINLMIPVPKTKPPPRLHTP